MGNEVYTRHYDCIPLVVILNQPIKIFSQEIWAHVARNSLYCLAGWHKGRVVQALENPREIQEMVCRILSCKGVAWNGKQKCFSFSWQHAMFSRCTINFSTFTGRPIVNLVATTNGLRH